MVTTAGENKEPSVVELQPYEQVAIEDPVDDGEKDLEADIVHATEIDSLQPQPAVSVPATVVRGPPPSHCFRSCWAFIFCCWPIGLYALAMSYTVHQRLNNNDIEGAYRASESASKAVTAAVVVPEKSQKAIGEGVGKEYKAVFLERGRQGLRAW